MTQTLNNKKNNSKGNTKYNAKHNPEPNCNLCPRLVSLRENLRIEKPTFFNSPIPTWLPPKNNFNKVELLIIGLAPGLKGANRTGRPFTGDFAGMLLYETLIKFGFAKGTYKADINDGLVLHKTAITNAVRCLPPQNKPIGEEINNCRQFLVATLQNMKNLKVIITLGGIAHATTLKTLDLKIKQFPFKHNKLHNVGNFSIISSYHCSRYNTQTKRLNEKMFQAVFQNAKNIIG